MREIDYEGDKTEVYSTKGRGDTFEEVLTRRLNRRSVLRSSAALGGIVLAGPTIAMAGQEATPSPIATGGTLTFTAITADSGPDLLVAHGYTAVPFLSWGDSLTAATGPFDPATLTAAAQSTLVGYNHDFVGFLPLPAGSDASDHGLVVVNHEYTNPELMFPGYFTPNPDFTEGSEDIPELLPNPTQDMVDVQLEAHGVTVVEVQRDDAGQWAVVADSPYNRRITATTPIEITGPAAGDDLLKTSDDRTGTRVAGTLNNCSGGLTPWGTFVTCEENFHQYFANAGAIEETNPIRAINDRFAMPEGATERLWEQFYPRFDVAQEPNEPFRFGWAVEIDPFDAASTPKKRTALGRFKHEAVNLVVTPGNQVAPLFR